MMTCSRRYFSGSACGSSRVLMIGRFSVVSRPDLDLEEVGALADLEAVLAAVLADADPAGAGDDLAGDEERREVPDDVAERGRARHQVVLVRAVRGALVVGVVLVEVDERAGRAGRRVGRAAGGLEHDPLPRLVPEHGVARVGALGRGVLRVGVVDVEPGAVGQDDVGQPEVVVARGRSASRGSSKPARVAQRVLLLEVPPGPAAALCGSAR